MEICLNTFGTFLNRDVVLMYRKYNILCESTLTALLSTTFEKQTYLKRENPRCSYFKHVLLRSHVISSEDKGRGFLWGESSFRNKALESFFVRGSHHVRLLL